MVDTAEPKLAAQGKSEAGGIPDLRGDIRPLIPKLGLRNYWYPGIVARKIPKRHPVQVKMLGEELCFFRGAQGQAVAIRDICPHRGARPSEGTCHWKGTVTCPYHGWTFDEHGKNVAVLSEGPDSKICGKPGTEATVFPTRELKGVVFVWIGDQEPAPIEEDVPEEFFDPRAYLFFNDGVYWKTNWAVALENFFDAHVSYLHRDNVQQVLKSPTPIARASPDGIRVVFTGNGFRFGRQSDAFVLSNPKPPPIQDVYPSGWKWPKHRFRRWWTWLFAPLFLLTWVTVPAPVDPERWGSGLKLPGMTRVGADPSIRGLGKLRVGSGTFVGRMSRQVVAVEPWLTRVWYFHYTRPRNLLTRAWHRLIYWSVYRWINEHNFSEQDGSVMPNQIWDAPEMLSATDSGVLQWRRLAVTKHFGGRDAPFGEERAAERPEGQAPESLPTP